MVFSETHSEQQVDSGTILESSRVVTMSTRTVTKKTVIESGNESGETKRTETVTIQQSGSGAGGDTATTTTTTTTMESGDGNKGRCLANYYYQYCIFKVPEAHFKFWCRRNLELFLATCTNKLFVLII